ncbi:fatty acid desaturase [Crocosphaera chwakensis]|uniref:Fatty acid desaturase family protein n=1 Tax=Crocosphaera chwakensis CCY0110 TaxID=391612 RepID=A3IPN7_9CHRO|nr:fatty acid desaturase [Crocosphaera chwakensis]EAZ91527.1 fatty acid desaturase family protein [Crocosphaera chwakensis CCY0110]
MLVKKRIDYYPITIILLVLGIDLVVFLFSPSALLPIIWMIVSLNIKGWICSWNHNHQHYNFFTVPLANRFIELVMGLQTGIVGEAWVLHHTLGHHLNYLNQSKDESAWKTPQGRLMSRLEYTFKVGFMAYPTALKVGKQHPKSRNKLIQNIVLTVLILGLLFSNNWLNTLIIFVAPMIILLFMVVYETYYHHAGLDQLDPYQASYNITDRWYNFFTCNLGYHTAHHLQCGKHWSQLPQLHQNIKHKIPPHLYREAGFPFSLMTKIEQQLSQRFSTN